MNKEHDEILEAINNIWNEYDTIPFGRLIAMIYKDGKKQVMSSNQDLLNILSNPNFNINSPPSAG